MADLKQKKLEEKKSVQIPCSIFIVLYLIAGCYSCNVLFSSLDTYTDRKKLEDHSSDDGSIKQKYNSIFYSILTHIICSMWLPICYVFSVHRKLLPFMRVIIVLVPVQLFSGATALFIAAHVLPFFSDQSDQLGFVMGFATLEMILISGHPVLIVLAFLMDEPKDDLTSFELKGRILWETDEEKREKTMTKARKRAQKWALGRPDVFVQ